MKLQNYQKKSLSSIQKIRDQGLESEIYIRNLTLQEHKLNDEITMIQTDTENGEKILDELSAVQNANKNKIWVRDTIAEDFQKLCEKWYWDDYFSKKRK